MPDGKLKKVVGDSSRASTGASADPLSLYKQEVAKAKAAQAEIIRKQEMLSKAQPVGKYDSNMTFRQLEKIIKKFDNVLARTIPDSRDAVSSPHEAETRARWMAKSSTGAASNAFHAGPMNRVLGAAASQFFDTPRKMKQGREPVRRRGRHDRSTYRLGGMRHAGRKFQQRLHEIKQRSQAKLDFAEREYVRSRDVHLERMAKPQSLEGATMPLGAALDRIVLGIKHSVNVMHALLSEGIERARIHRSIPIDARSAAGKEARTITMREAVRRAAIKRAAIKQASPRNQYNHALAGARMVQTCSQLRLVMQRGGRVGRAAPARSISHSARGVSRSMCFAACAMTNSLSGAKMRGILATRMHSGQDAAAKSQQPHRAQSNLIMQSGQLVVARGEQNTRAPARFSSPRMSNLLSRMRNGQLNPALWCPSHINDQQGPYSPSIPTDDELFSVAAIREREAGEILVSQIVEQLKCGPAEIENEKFRNEVNAALPEIYDSINRETWVFLLRKTLLLAVRQVKIFDDNGLRMPEEIYADATEMLELDHKRFAEWEAHFGIYGIADNLMAFDDIFGMSSEPASEDIINAIEVHLAARASGAIETCDHRAAHQHLFETKYQWAAVCFSGMQETKQKIAQTAAFVMDLAKKDRLGAGLMLAMIVRHSALSRYRKSKGILVPQWQTEELRVLLRTILDDVPYIVSDSCFRSLLSEWQNKSLNDLLYKTNYGDVMKKLRRMGDVSIDRFFDAIEKADESGKVYRDIIIQMIANYEKFKPQ